MILGSVGTDRFEELVKAIDEVSKEIDEKIIIQIGKGRYKPKHCEYFTFVPTIEPYYKKANLIVTHGGAGAIYRLLGKGKKIVGVSNFHKPGRHQEQILKIMSKNGHLFWCKDLSKLKESILKARKMKFVKYNPPKCEINKVIEKNIEKWFKI